MIVVSSRLSKSRSVSSHVARVLKGEAADHARNVPLSGVQVVGEEGEESVASFVARLQWMRYRERTVNGQ